MTHGWFVRLHGPSETLNSSFASQQGREMMTQIHVLIQFFFDKVHVVLPLVYTVDVLPQPDMLLIGLSSVALRHGLADMERAQVTQVTLVLDTFKQGNLGSQSVCWA